MPAVRARIKGGKNYFQGKYHFTVTKLLEQRLMPAARACVKMKKQVYFDGKTDLFPFTKKKQTYFLSQKKAYSYGKRAMFSCQKRLISMEKQSL